MKHGGKNAKRGAVVAVARKLGVLLHHLWVNGEVYDPHDNGQAGAVRGRSPGRKAGQAAA